ncbi:uncharacterized protein LOC120115510 [Hibiscus syriacus]|uniref:uncharacterized protein LOC120115510 n=1 Tax=Hibiscus syriacus TaxID=106335 RepID=UPI00192132D0|nr:uncharacterized protein LOC120115510 [Hibiscus syriacus]
MWSPSDENSVCLNTDGALSQLTKTGSVGGLLRNSAVLEVELWAILEALQVPWQRDAKRVLVQTDSSDTHDLLSPPSIGSPFALVRLIETLYDKPWSVVFIKIYCEANSAADYIAKMDTPQDGSVFIFDFFSATFTCYFS